MSAPVCGEFSRGPASPATGRIDTKVHSMTDWRRQKLSVEPLSSAWRDGFAMSAVRVGLVMFLSMLSMLASPAAATRAAGDPFAVVARRLVADGFAAERVHALYSAPGAAFDTEGVSLFFVHSEARLNYDQFAEPAAIARARRYMGQHQEALAGAQETYGVNEAVITGIILVETQLGTMPGRRPVFNTLSTMAALADPVVRHDFWGRIPEKRRISPAQFEAKAAAKSAWAYAELKAFLKYTAREGIDPFVMVGSYAGAMGICQFMPSNALRLAVDGDRDGRVDLFDHDDAIASVANYLRHHGWRPDLSRKKRYQVILRYNYSKYYANIILKIADILARG